MGIEVGTAALISAIVGGLSAGGAAYSGHQARQDAKDEGKKAEEKARKLDTDRRNQSALDEKKLEADEARKRQRLRAMGALGRRGTILTGPLGLSGESEGKDLLGN